MNDCDRVLEGVASSGAGGNRCVCVEGMSSRQIRKRGTEVFPRRNRPRPQTRRSRQRRRRDALQHAALLLARLRFDTRPSEGRLPALPSLFLTNTGRDARKTVRAVSPERSHRPPAGPNIPMRAGKPARRFGERPPELRRSKLAGAVARFDGIEGSVCPGDRRTQTCGVFLRRGSGRARGRRRRCRGRTRFCTGGQRGHLRLIHRFLHRIHRRGFQKNHVYHDQDRKEGQIFHPCGQSTRCARAARCGLRSFIIPTRRWWVESNGSWQRTRVSLHPPGTR